MKNGGPLTKLLVVFLMAPKGLIIFGPLMIKKCLNGAGFPNFAQYAPMLLGTARVALGLGAYMAFNYWRMNKALTYCKLGMTSNIVPALYLGSSAF